MKLFYYESPIPHVIIENYFDDNELKRVWAEIDFLTSDAKLGTPKETGTAYKPIDNPTDGVKKALTKQNRGIWLDETYSKREYSDILQCTRKHIDRSIMDALSSYHFVFDYLKHSKFDATLLSYYQNSDNYFPHFDASAISCVTWLYKEPKSFEGGEFIFSDSNYKIPVLNNHMIIFPSIVRHSVDPVTMLDNMEPFSGYGRYSITQFFSPR